MKKSEQILEFLDKEIERVKEDIKNSNDDFNAVASSAQLRGFLDLRNFIFSNID